MGRKKMFARIQCATYKKDTEITLRQIQEIFVVKYRIETVRLNFFIMTI